MKKLYLLPIFLIIGLFIFFSITVKIPVGYVGIKVNLYGGSKGVDVIPLNTGRNFYNPITHDVYKYPTFIQQTQYKDIIFQDKDGLKIRGNIGIDYQFNSSMVPKIYEDYRVGISTITNNYMFTWLTNSINRSSSKFEVDKLYGEDKEKFRLSVLESLKSDLDSKGIIVNNIYFVTDFILPDQVMGRINAKIEATQNAMQKENELRAVKAEAEKQIAEAKGYNESQIIKAQADAEAIRIKTEAIKSQGGSEYVQLQAIEKWNGVLPVTSLGENVPFINLK